MFPLADPRQQRPVQTLALGKGRSEKQGFCHLTPPPQQPSQGLSLYIVLLGVISGFKEIHRSEMAQQAPAGSTHAAQVVGNAFVHQYYHILHQSPELVFRFYQDISKLGRLEENGIMGVTTTMEAINEKILSLNYGDLIAEIKSVDAQESFGGGVLVLVTGYLTGKDNRSRDFTQSFFLAPQDKGYFVLNDLFRYIEDVKYQDGNPGLVSEVEAPLTPEQDPSPVQENHILEPTPEVPEEVNEEVYNPSENGEASVEEEEAPVAEVVDEIQDDQMVTISDSKILEVPKKSYASIVKVMKESSVPFSSPTPPPSRPVPKIQEQQVTVAPLPTPGAEANAIENGNNQDGEADGHSIYIRGLPSNATPALLEDEFKKFGPIKSGGVQVRSNKQGFCFGFVEFEVASAVQSAMEASPITIGGRQAFVEEKRSTNSSRGKLDFMSVLVKIKERHDIFSCAWCIGEIAIFFCLAVNNRTRFSNGRGVVFRNEGGRGRGNYGGNRGYNRGDFNSRSDFGNRGSRGGFPNRGGDGYQRTDHVGSNGGRVNRASGLTVNAAAKTTAPRVSASA
ncbi:putative G3BP-like protein [Vitis vinifera]|uniref:Putative G3BP-like protein n=1 Tax=Vitis vinifera TaxID=29760 RepID=A0A438FJI4_VITVI|nr:putative G3BP-like protein [Vitis vinifera]